MERGERLSRWEVTDSKSYAEQQLSHVAPEHQRFENPHVYKVGISKDLLDLRSKLVDEFQKAMPVPDAGGLPDQGDEKAPGKVRGGRRQA